jgi:hypothetical protein
MKLESLQLGSGLELLRTRFRQTRGADENYPARQWAKAAVRTVEETRWRYISFAEYSGEFEQMMMEGKIDLAATPEWVTGALKLPPFSSVTARDWGKVIREMIREQASDFHTLPEWSGQRNTARQNCRDSRGEIQNAILDDIVSALRRLAPAKKLPKSSS